MIRNKKKSVIKKKYSFNKSSKLKKRRKNKTIKNKKKFIKKGGADDDRDKCYVALLELLDNLDKVNPERNEDDKGLFKYKEITSSNMLYDKYRQLYGIYDKYTTSNNGKQNSKDQSRDIYYLRKLLDYLTRCIKNKSNQQRWEQVTHDGIYMPEIIQQIKLVLKKISSKKLN